MSAAGHGTISGRRAGSRSNQMAGMMPIRTLFMQQDKVDWRHVAEIGADIADLLDREHRAGRPLRLLTPDCILVNPDSMVCALTAPRERISLPVPSPDMEYEAPELWRAPNEADYRAEQFSLGVILYELLAGEGLRPFRVDFWRPQGSGDSTQVEVSYSPQNDLRSLVPKVPERLIRVIERATRLSPNNRFDNCGRLADMLRSSLEPEAEAVPPPARSREHWPTRIGIATLLAVMVTVVAYVLLPFIAGSGIREQMEAARHEAEVLNSSHYVSTLWRQAEEYQPANAYEDRLRLYRTARDRAWRIQWAQVNESARYAIDFEATGDEAYSRGVAALDRAALEWKTEQVREAALSITEAEEAFRSAADARRAKLAADIRAQLEVEAATIQQNGSSSTAEAFQAQQIAIERAISDPEASATDLRRAENALADLRHEVATAMAESGKIDVARQSAKEAITQAEQAHQLAQSWAGVSDRARGSFDRGAAFLLSARDAMEKDPSRALALADAAAQQFRSVQSTAQTDGTVLAYDSAWDPQMADRAKSAQQAEADRSGAPAGKRAGNLWEDAPRVADSFPAALPPALDKKPAASRDTAQLDTTRSRQMETAPARVAADLKPKPGDANQQVAALPRLQPSAQHNATPAAVSPRAAALPKAPATPPGVAALAARPEVFIPPAAQAVPTAGSPQILPMPPTLARDIQQWMRQRCEALNRELAATERHARCDNLIVHERPNRSKIRISYTLALGDKSEDGIRWEPPTKREAQLDCSQGECRCTSDKPC